MVCEEKREDELEGGWGGGVMGYTPTLEGHTHINTGSAEQASQHCYHEYAESTLNQQWEHSTPLSLYIYILQIHSQLNNMIVDNPRYHNYEFVDVW